MRKLIFTTFFVFLTVTMLAQTSTGITGKVVDSKTQKPLKDVVAAIQNSNLTQVTDAAGKFTFSDVAPGTQILQIKTAGFKDQFLQVEVTAANVSDLGTIVMEEDITEEQQLGLIALTENDLGDDNSGSETTSGLLQASRDAFQQSAAFNWGQARFRIRGLDNEYGTTMINGIIMNKIYDGRPQWSNWGGLNDATRNQEFTTGSAPSDYTFGGILGTQEINTRASIYRPGNRVSLATTNTNYSYRVMGTHASGMSPDGWAFVVSAGKRWAEEGYFEGTDYDAPSLFASIEKKLTEKHSLNFTSIYAKNSRGKNSPNTQEVTDIAGIKYNSYWGYQNGEKRNSRDKDVEEPINILSHYWKLNNKTLLNTNIAYQTGSIGNSRLEYQNVSNPDPTYYRNLPSYFTSLYSNDPLTTPSDAFSPGGLGGVATPDLISAANARFYNQPQIDWEGLYRANQSTTDGNSVYVLYEDRTDDDLFTANSILNSQLSDNVGMTAAVTYRKLKSHNFQNLLDLLGGQYFVDVDLFGTGQQRQTDLNNPNRRVIEGDAFGYNYNITSNNIDAFTQFKFAYRKFDFYLANSYSRAEYEREGLYRNGYYPTASFGKSNTLIFDNFGFKGGLTYKISGRIFLNGNALYMTKAPSLRNVFPNARISNNTLDEIGSETVSSADASFIMNLPNFKARLTGYYSKIQNATETSFFFGEGIFEDDGGDGGDAFVAETTTNIDKKNIGAELGLEYQITSTIKLTGSAAYGEYRYDNNPNVYLNRDESATATNTNPVISYGQSNLKDLRLSGSPQQAYSVGIEYRDPHFWWIAANGNYLDDNYIDVSPLLRTGNFVRSTTDISGFAFPEATDARVGELLRQQKFASFYLVNVTGGKSWRIKNKTLGFFATINNVLDETYKTGGFEQTRNASFRELNQDVSSGTPAFAPKYFYGYGRTYFVNVYVSF